MSFQNNPHTFHIPVLGLCYTMDTPIKVAHYGISSAISLVDDITMEKLREFYCQKFNLPFQSIPTKTEDHRAKRITAYLNTVQVIVKQKFENLKNSVSQKEEELEKYIAMLPDMSEIKQKFNQMINTADMKQKLSEWLKENLVAGEIDVNIMSKLDRDNFKDGEKLPSIYSDAQASLRGFALSDLSSSLVLSAGMNPRLYSYLEEFEDFYPNAQMELKKKVILKVSDYRSALIQGRFLAKKGIWVSEYRVESGLNCGGHAFATDGFLMGPVLEEFKQNKEQLIETVHDIYVKALAEKGKPVPEKPFLMKITAQGGVGSNTEHQFLLDYYNLDSIGWGTPFLLVPEAVTVDEQTLEVLVNAKEEDLYMSDVSPLGVIFNNVRGTGMDLKKEAQNKEGKYGFPCVKKYLALTPVFTEEGTCTASKEFQRKKIQELKEQNLNAMEFEKELNKITDKACLCNGLTASSLMEYGLDTKIEGTAVSICPGPNLAYFSSTYSLKKMVDHIYGRTNVMERTDRPNLFMKELSMYIEYLNGKLEETVKPFTDKQKKHFVTFQENLNKGVEYYKELFQRCKTQLEDSTSKNNLMADLEKMKLELANLKAKLV
ncbi:hypothetical protein AQPE_4501 [Aquipluma nitroreducens]|uniref:Uncharacterized protein n=1 Tax=Aquipluma nitroreducens TaxID=2010828 RepID=A0A5K7SFD2_9BACT|nr:hypothetical protein [Aquipluma nitroreducens]BBE20310.1 hypothetical protein AQPE_4501 [Aquipluma nitroreducens]